MRQFGVNACVQVDEADTSTEIADVELRLGDRTTPIASRYRRRDDLGCAYVGCTVARLSVLPSGDRRDRSTGALRRRRSNADRWVRADLSTIARYRCGTPDRFRTAHRAGHEKSCPRRHLAHPSESSTADADPHRQLYRRSGCVRCALRRHRPPLPPMGVVTAVEIAP